MLYNNYLGVFLVIFERQMVLGLLGCLFFYTELCRKLLEDISLTFQNDLIVMGCIPLNSKKHLLQLSYRRLYKLLEHMYLYFLKKRKYLAAILLHTAVLVEDKQYFQQFLLYILLQQGRHNSKNKHN